MVVPSGATTYYIDRMEITMAKQSENMEYQKAINHIVQMVKDGQLIVGSKIPSERDLSESLGIGRNSTREAISILRGMGLVESRHGSGNYIAKDSGAAIRSMIALMLALKTVSEYDLLEFRRYFSHIVVDCVMKKGISEKRKEQLYSIIDKMKTANGQDLVRLDFEFHVGLIECTENPLLITVSRPVAELCIKSMSNVIENADEMIKEKLLSLHTNILDNLVNQDETASTDSFNQHYDLVENRLGGIH